MKTKKRLCCMAIALTFMASIVSTPTKKINALENSYGTIKETGENMNISGLQADITFPDYMNYVDDTLIVNNMFTFKGYEGQGKLYIKCSDGLESVRVFINGKEINVTEACKNNGKTYEVDFSDISVNDRNTIQVTNFVPETGKVNIKIPYPEVIEGNAESVGMDQNTLDLIDTLINNDVKYGFTSAQLAVIKDGVLVKNSAYGTVNAYNNDGSLKTDSPKVTTDTLYDLASNTKMYSTNYAIQKLVSDGQINISDKITKYFPDFKDGENDPIKGKAGLTIQHLLEHQGGFPADPQYHNNKFNQATQKPDQTVDNPLYSQDKATTLQMILKTPLQYAPGTKTVYSDVDYMLLGLIVEKVTGKALDEYVENTFYKPLGLNNIVYNPLQKGFDKDNIAATELNGNTRDGAISFENIRDYTLQGEVHDEKAYYSMDGVSGHAGLFSNAEDLAKLAQVMLNDGGYGNNKFFSKNTVEEFTKRKASSPIWGLGWWREGDNGRLWYFGTQSSSNTFGHQGWTGTLTVIDPESDLIVVLLTNKINSPVIDNSINANMFLGNKFTTSTLGTIPTLVYESIEHSNKKAIDANLSNMVTEKLKLYNPSNYQGEAILKAAYAVADTMVTRAEECKVKSTVDYAYASIEEINKLDSNKTIINELKSRVDNIQLEEEASSDLSKITLSKLSESPNAQWQADIAFPDYLNYVDDTLIVNGMFTFNGYQNQGKLYIKAEPGITSARIFVNGVEMDTTEICSNTGKTFEIDYSQVANNGRNTIQVTNIEPKNTAMKKGISVKIPYPEVIEGNAESVGMEQNTLDLIDTLINNDVKYGFTSAQLAVIKDGVLVKNSAYGTVNAYNQDGSLKTDSPKVTTDTLYDLASNTKMYSTNYAIQKLVSDGQINISDKITKYFPDFKDGENDPIKGKAGLTIQHLLEHQGGFPADPQYHNNKFNQATQKPDQTVDNPLYSQDKATTLQMILRTPLQYAPGTKTVYSDVDYMLLGLIVEKVTGKALDEYVENTFYKPLGLNNIVYNPLQKGFDKDNIAATELNGNTRDGAISFENIRDYTLQGEVHDEKAYYSMDGVSGHAGLFSNAEDLAKLAQVMLNDGGYGNNKFFSKNTVEEFTKRKASSPIWGLGWWREGDNGRLWYFGTQSSSNTFGHQGWTGTLTVIDPESDLIVVLLTNKINSPVIDNSINANMFLGNKFTTSTLGTIPTLVYESMIHNNDDAIDANLAQMVSENLKLYNSNNYTGEAILKSVYSKIDTVITRAEENKTSSNIAYAEEVVAKLNVEENRKQIMKFNERIKNVGGTPIELPNYSSEIEALNKLAEESKVIVDKGQDLSEHVHYQTSTWDKFIKSYNSSMDVLSKGIEANNKELNTAIEELSIAKNALVKLDKTNLNKAIEAANSKIAEGILEEVDEEIKISFNNALEVAKTVYNNKDTGVQDIVKAYNDILVEYKKLGIPVGDKNNLSDLVNMAEAINLDRFLSKGQDEFKKALQGAKDILSKEEISEIDSYTSYESLYKSMMQLVLKADKSELCKAIANTEEINLSLYTENSKTKLLSVLEAVKLVKENQEVTQEEVEVALESLNNAIKALVKSADKSELESLIRKAEGIDTNKYKSEGVERFIKALNEAKIVMEDKNISEDNQELVNISYSNLNSAIEALQLKESSNGNSGNGSNNGGKEDNKDQEDSNIDNKNNDKGTNNNGKGNSDLPGTGGTSPIIYVVIGALAIGFGAYIFRKKSTLDKV
ncbi:penicillin binding protein PBP4B [Clostridium sp. C8]|nr:penicillin binding protein PBP4B [Clostridium sp. C8]